MLLIIVLFLCFPVLCLVVPLGMPGLKSLAACVVLLALMIGYVIWLGSQPEADGPGGVFLGAWIGLSVWALLLTVPVRIGLLWWNARRRRVRERGAAASKVGVF